MNRIHNFFKHLVGFIRPSTCDSNGAIVVGVSFALVPVLAVCAFFMDGSRAMLGAAVAKSSEQVTISGVLAHSDRLLQENYGLFALEQGFTGASMLTVPGETANNLLVKQELPNKYINEFKNNLKSTGTDFLQIAEDPNNPYTLQGVQGGNLANPAILESQIANYSKYRGVAKFISDLMGNKDEAAESTQKAADAEAGTKEVEKYTKAEETFTKTLKDYKNAAEAVKNLLYRGSTSGCADTNPFGGCTIIDLQEKIQAISIANPETEVDQNGKTVYKQDFLNNVQKLKDLFNVLKPKVDDLKTKLATLNTQLGNLKTNLKTLDTQFKESVKAMKDNGATKKGCEKESSVVSDDEEVSPIDSMCSQITTNNNKIHEKKINYKGQDYKIKEFVDTKLSEIKDNAAKIDSLINDIKQAIKVLNDMKLEPEQPVVDDGYDGYDGYDRCDGYDCDDDDYHDYDDYWSSHATRTENSNYSKIVNDSKLPDLEPFFSYSKLLIVSETGPADFTFRAEGWNDEIRNDWSESFLNSIIALDDSQASGFDGLDTNNIDPSSLVDKLVAKGVGTEAGQIMSRVWTAIKNVPGIFTAIGKMASNCQDNSDKANYIGCKHYINQVPASQRSTTLPSGIYCGKMNNSPHMCKGGSSFTIGNVGLSLLSKASGIIGIIKNLVNLDFSSLSTALLDTAYIHYAFDDASWNAKAGEALSTTLAGKSQAVAGEDTLLQRTQNSQGKDDSIAGGYADVEYILDGMSGQYTSVIPYFDIFMLRMALNFASCFSVTTVNSIANTINAIPIAGPILAILFRLMISIVETSIDITELVQNHQKVVFYKSNKTWLSTNPEYYTKGYKAPSDGLKFGYSDYLSIMLVTQLGDNNNREAAMARVADVLQAKMYYLTNSDPTIASVEEKKYFADQFRMKNALTDVQLKGSFKMNPFFINIVPTDIFKGLKNQNQSFGIYNFNVSAIGGY
jgi:hypothetical protein